MDLAHHPWAAKLSIAQSFISEVASQLASRMCTVHIVGRRTPEVLDRITLAEQLLQNTSRTATELQLLQTTSTPQSQPLLHPRSSNSNFEPPRSRSSKLERSSKELIGSRLPDFRYRSPELQKGHVRRFYSQNSPLRSRTDAPPWETELLPTREDLRHSTRDVRPAAESEQYDWSELARAPITKQPNSLIDRPRFLHYGHCTAYSATLAEYRWVND